MQDLLPLPIDQTVLDFFPLEEITDASGNRTLKGLLVAAARDEDTTVVLVTHEASVAAYADREVIVRDGTVTSMP